MASFGLTSTVSKFATTRTLFVRNPLTSTKTSPSLGKLCYGTMGGQESAANTARYGVNELKRAGSQIKDQTASTAENMAEKSKDVAGKAADAAQDIVEKAKQTAQDAWSSAKDTAQKVKDTVAEKAEESADFIKENAKTVKRSMNSKN